MTTKLSDENMAVDTPIKKRLFKLMTDDEKLMPFKFATRIGISPSTFHSLWTKSASSMQRRTAEKIAQATGTDPDWIQTGAIKVEPNDVSREWGITEVYPANGVSIEPSDYQQPEHIKDMNPTLLIEAMAMVEEVLTETGRTMEAMHKAELVLRVYELLALNPQPTTEFKDTLKRTLKIA